MERRMKKTLRLALGLLLPMLAACYSTNGLKNGTLVCGANSSCPDGFACFPDGQPGQSGHCYRPGSGPDAATTPGPDSAPPGQDVAGPPVCPPYGPFAICSSGLVIGSSTCDPVCQSGCGCGHRCILDQTDYNSFLCEPTAQSANTTFIQPSSDCAGANATQCAPGSVCLSDVACPNLCYKTCRSDVDCASDSRCTKSTIDNGSSAPLQNVWLCSPPIRACNPTGTADCLVKRASFSCVFLAGLTGTVNDSSTVCDCATMHNKKVGDTCSTAPDDCRPGSSCVGGTCKLLCTTKTAAAPCPTSNPTCVAIYGSPAYGYCR
jgi:hypothetical protein